MSSAGPLRSRRPEPVALEAHAADNLRFIRETMERAGSFTAVPGWGGFAIGWTALAASVVAAQQTSPNAWLATWLAEALVAVGIAAGAPARKARAAKVPLLSGPGRKFAPRFVPPLLRGGPRGGAHFPARYRAGRRGTWQLL